MLCASGFGFRILEGDDLAVFFAYSDLRRAMLARGRSRPRKFSATEWFCKVLLIPNSRKAWDSLKKGRVGLGSAGRGAN